MKTYATKATDIKHDWHLINAEDKVLGRLATRIAGLLQGKHKPMFSRNIDTGDYVVVINAEKIKITGGKLVQKTYRRHTLYAGGFKEERLEEVMAKHPTRALEHAVRGMLPHNRIGDAMMKKLRVYAGGEHPHEAQLRPAKKEEEKPEKKA